MFNHPAEACVHMGKGDQGREVNWKSPKQGAPSKQREMMEIVECIID